MSKSARKRANQKARAGAEKEEQEEAPAPAPKAKPAAKPAAKEKAAPKAKAEPKAAAAPVPEAKSKAKAKAKAEPKAVAAAPEEPKAASKAKAAAKSASAKAKPKAKAEPEPEVKEESKGPVTYYEIDDGSRNDEWEVSSGLSKKQQKQKEKSEEKKQMEKAQKSGAVLQAKANQHIPGLAPAEVQIAQAKGKAAPKAKASQSVVAVADVSAAAAAGKGKEPEKAAAPDNNVSVNIKVEEKKIGWVVGPKGANINLIKEKTGIKTFDMNGDVCTLIGSPDAVGMAEHAVRQLLDKGYMSLQYEDYEEDGVQVHPSLFPDLIGKGGVIIQEIKKQAKVEVNIPAVPKNGPAGKKYRVTLAGSKASVTLGKEIINSIALYGHHDLTHPGQAHKELEIEQWRFPFLIGSKGSELRHIQNNYKVKVNIPREFSANQNVVIVGEPRDIERANTYIEKILYEAAEPRGRGAADKADDAWGDEGEVEDWMRPYMYQRK
jgi:rRNA processing protein Krr1/Pno1